MRCEMRDQNDEIGSRSVTGEFLKLKFDEICPPEFLWEDLCLGGSAFRIEARMLLKSAYKLRRENIQNRRNAHNRAQRGILLTALQLANVRRMVAAFECERLLRELPLFAKLAQRLSEALFGSAGRASAMPLHAQTNTRTTETIVTRDYSTELTTACRGAVFALAPLRVTK